MGLKALTLEDVAETLPKPRLVSPSEASNILSGYSEARVAFGLDRLLDDLDKCPEGACGCCESLDDAGDEMELRERPARHDGGMV